MPDAIANIIDTVLESERVWSLSFGVLAESARLRKALLVLFRQQMAQVSVRTKDFLFLGEIPTASGHRMLSILENEGLIIRQADLPDGRCQTIKLTPEGIQKLTIVTMSFAINMSAIISNSS